MLRVMRNQTIRLVNIAAQKPGILRPEPGAILRGQLSPTKMSNVNVKRMGIAKGISSLAKKVGDTAGWEVRFFVTSK